MTTHIKEILGGFLKEKRKDVKRKEEIEEIVEKIIDKKLKKHVQLKRIYKNSLIFYSESSNYSFEFYLKKEQLLEKIKEKFPYIEDIKVKVG